MYQAGEPYLYLEHMKNSHSSTVKDSAKKQPVKLTPSSQEKMLNIVNHQRNASQTAQTALHTPYEGNNQEAR